ncbi:MAG: hypothetical protein ACLTTJ_08230 [Blautia sp.]
MIVDFRSATRWNFRNWAFGIGLPIHGETEADKIPAGSIVLLVRIKEIRHTM